MRNVVAVFVVGAVLAVTACSSSNEQQKAGGSTSTPTGTLGPPVAAKPSALAWDDPAAKAFNGDLTPAEPEKVCGATDRRFLAELLGGNNPLQYKVPKRLGDIKATPSQVVLSGAVVNSVLGTGDFPFDHTMGSDYNADIKLDPQFIGIGQHNAATIDTVHIELAAGQLPHTTTAPGVPQRIWTEMTAAAREHLQDGFVAREGDRVLVMGNWIVDCGHTDFQTEIHPITFMAVARTERDATVVHLFYNPWRETQLYNPDPAKTIDFERPGRLSDPTNVPFPKGLIDSVLRLGTADTSWAPGSPAIASWAVLEPNMTTPTKWRVCAPTASGVMKVGASIVTRPGVTVTVSPGDDGCATVTMSLDGMAPAQPMRKTCTIPWAFLSEVATEEASGEREGAGGKKPAPLDLRAELAKFVPPQYRSRLDADPVMNCYDPIAGPDLGGARPTSIDVRNETDASMPFFGTIVVRPTP